MIENADILLCFLMYFQHDNLTFLIPWKPYYPVFSLMAPIISLFSDLDSVQPQQRCQYLMRLLKATMPVQVALVVALGLAYLLEPEMGDLGLTLNPQLRYVRGPPPT